MSEARGAGVVLSNSLSKLADIQIGVGSAAAYGFYQADCVLLTVMRDGIALIEVQLSPEWAEALADLLRQRAMEVSSTDETGGDC